MLTTAEIQNFVLESVQQILEDTDLGLDEPVSMETKLNRDLCLSSVEVLELFGLLDVRMRRRLPYDQLIMQKGQYRNELTIGELVDFAYALQEHVHAPVRAM
jgi:acyl carrier protein